VSHSQTETITDWGIALNDLDNWTFYQNSPWDSRKETWQGDMVDYNAGKFRYEVKELPALSTSVMDYSTMSVYYNNAVSTSTVYVDVSLNGYWNYVGIENKWPSYCGEWWGQPFGTTLSYAIDLSLVS
jgi:hypothetical protein